MASSTSATGRAGAWRHTWEARGVGRAASVRLVLARSPPGSGLREGLRGSRGLQGLRGAAV